MQIVPRIIVALLFFCLAGCKKESQAEWALRENILILGNGAEPKSLDPGTVQSVGDSNIMLALFEGLVNYHPSSDVEPVPGVAERWEAADNYQQWTFFLRKDAKWSNGDPVTADDFVYSYRRTLTPEYASPYASMLYFLKNAEAFAKTDYVHLFFKDREDFPVDWEALEAFKPSLNGLTTEQLTQIQTGEVEFTWPVEITEEQQKQIIDELLEFQTSGKPLWDVANVGVKAKDKHTLVCNLERPTEFFTGVVKHQTWSPVHQATIEKFGKMTAPFSEWQLPGNHVGNGPYQLKEWRINKYVKVERNPHYWEKDGKGPKEIWFIPADAPTEERLFRDGLIHSTYVLPNYMIEYHREHTPDLLRTDPYLGTYFYRCNTKRPPMDDPLVRKALSLAIDRKQIVEQVTLGGQMPCIGFTPPIEGGYHPPEMLEFNPEKARETLKQSKYYGNMPEFELLINVSEAHKAIAEAIQDMWREHLGLGPDKVSINNQEWKVFQQTIFEERYDVARSGWIADFVDPTTFLDMWRTGDSNNNTGWANARYDKLLQDAAYAKSAEERVKILQQAETILLEELPVLPIYHYTSVYLHNPGVQNWHPLVLRKNPYKDVILVPQQEEKP